MIARMWHGIVPEQKADPYHEYMDQTGFADYYKTPGFIDLKVLRNTQDGLTHYHILTFWEDYEAIRRFAGDDYTKAQYYPMDKEYLIELEELVSHYEVMNASKPCQQQSKRSTSFDSWAGPFS